MPAASPVGVLRANVDFAKRILTDRVGNDYVYGGNWNPNNTSVGTDCSGLVVDICDAVRNGPRMAWSRHGMSTESWRPIEVGQTGTIFNTVCVAHPRDFPPDAVVKIAFHHGPGGGANSHTWCEVDGMRGESNGSNGCVTGSQAMSVYDTSYANDWHYIPGPILGSAANIVAPQPLTKRDQYAQAIIREGQRRGITPRGIQIALATALVESDLKMWANASVPSSMGLPHDAVGSDYDSVGLFQQRCPMWGPAAVLMDPSKSAGLFYDHLIRLDYNDPDVEPGWFAQAVQVSAFPDRYQQRFADAVALYTRLATTTGDDSMAQVPQEQWDAVYRELTQRLPSRSIYRTPGEGLIDTPAGMLLNVDAMTHAELVERLARLGDRDAVARVARTAAGQGAVTDPHAVAQAATVLADIERANPAILADYLKG
ncbi:MAG TPA: chitinase [Mycobacterium sp.]|nr:chitinase [Mycobacterium sp.]